jgi:hypothetical protein
MTSLDYRFDPRDDAFILEITANIAYGWSKLPKGYGFREQVNGQFRGDYRVRIVVDVLRNGYLKRTSVFPNELSGSYENDCLCCNLDRGLLRVKVPVPRNPCRRLSDKGNLVIFCEAWPVALAGDATCGLSLLITFFAPQEARPQDIREWDTQFCSGGLPSLGKRS